MRKIVKAICETEGTLRAMYPPAGDLSPAQSRGHLHHRPGAGGPVSPVSRPKEREDAVTQECRTVFIQGIGGALKSGRPHDGRAPTMTTGP